MSDIVPIKITLDETNISRARKWMHAMIVLELPKGWGLDYTWGRDHPEPIVGCDYDGHLRVGVRKLMGTKEE